ncbi:hypothetical protein QJS10_CPA05g01005 [Acorus calamus]|uniref:Reverse transcriptase zinc-binding domain-containing protein n=1 Tax=Acorus calamus TaxID=4465 RepID=A0AAV9ESN7_ACOCL|nr:hypothetical protein QJS10_CPA05g01005 [Acorus calamus]
MGSFRDLQGLWVVKNLSEEEDDHINELLLEIVEVSIQDDHADVMVWKPQSHSGFSIKSCYAWTRRFQPQILVIASRANEIWGPKIPLKIKAFTWLLFQEKILTKTVQAKCSHQEDIRCSLCGFAEEYVEHLFATCIFACQLWSLMKEATGLSPATLSIQGLWEAGRDLKKKGDRSVVAKRHFYELKPGRIFQFRFFYTDVHHTLTEDQIGRPS